MVVINRWTPEMDRILLDVLIECTLNGSGRRADNGWKAESLTRVSNNVNANIPREGRSPITNDHVRARLKTIKFQYLLAKEMLTLSGFELDPETMMITGDKHAWDSYIQAHPDASVLRRKALTNYDDWAIICGNENATGCKQNSGFESSPTIQLESGSLDDIFYGDDLNSCHPTGTPTPRSEGSSNPTQASPNPTPHGEGPSNTTQESPNPTPRGEGSSIPNIGKGKKRTRARALPDFVEINECFKSMVSAAKEMVANTKKTDYTKVNQALKDLNLSNRVLLLAMKLFTGNKDLPSAFLAIDSGLRKSWLDLMIDGVIPDDIDHDRDSGWM